jgi:isoquinoline 1-oxidoreductase alpha subunit
MGKIEQRLIVNGTPVVIAAEDDMPLLWFLRELLGMTGTKFGCGIAQCGACTVLVRGAPVRSCVTPVAAVAGGEVVTVEGLAGSGLGARVRRAWIDENVPQCGYCQSGMQVEAVALLARTPQPTDADIDAAFGGHVCRCGTYLRIRRAIATAAEA